MSSDPEYGYRTVAVEASFPWPDKARVLEFKGHEFQLLPTTQTHGGAIRGILRPGFSLSSCDRAILELLSALAWAEQAGAESKIANWCTAPLGVGGHRSGMVGSGHFDYLPDPKDPRAKLALALFREGLSANLVPYQFLGFFKVINVIRRTADEQKHWIDTNLKHVTDRTAVARILEIRQTPANVAEYLFVSGRCAVAHAFSDPVINPDDPVDLARLNTDLPVIRELARVAIEQELGVKSKRAFQDEHLH